MMQIDLIPLLQKVETATKISAPWLEAFHFFSCLYVWIWLSWQIRCSSAWMIHKSVDKCWTILSKWSFWAALVSNCWCLTQGVFSLDGDSSDDKLCLWYFTSLSTQILGNFPVKQTTSAGEFSLLSQARQSAYFEKLGCPENFKYTEEKANCSLIRAKKCTGCTVCWSLSQWKILWGPSWLGLPGVSLLIPTRNVIIIIPTDKRGHSM